MSLGPTKKLGLARHLAKTGTATKKKHRFQSFNQRIARIDIDPIRRRKPGTYDDEDVTGSGSFFKASLDRWKDLNLSENFRNFILEVDPLCQSLPQILHNEESLFQSLYRYIEKQDVHSLEPLLDLLSQLAHDTGAKFEVHFSSAVTLVASTASTHHNIDAIEWSFSCLTWLFKFLSRLLAPDLRPLFHIMAPLLGKVTHKRHTMRFAAEAFAFLVRKATNMYDRDPCPLQRIVDTIQDDLNIFAKISTEHELLEQYKYGIMTLYLNAVKGVDRKLHAHGVHLYHCLLECNMSEESENQAGEDILYGLTIALIHHTDAEGLKPLKDLILDEIKHSESDTARSRVEVCSELLLLLSTVRKGSRITEWERMLNAGLTLLRRISDLSLKQASGVVEMIAVILQAAPSAIILSRVRIAIDIIANDIRSRLFLVFCNSFDRLHTERFQELLMPHLDRYVAINWADNRMELLVLLTKLVNKSKHSSLGCPDGWQHHIIERFKNLESNTETAVECTYFLKCMQLLSTPDTFPETIMDILRNKINDCLHSATVDHSSPIRLSLLGPFLKSFSEHDSRSGTRLDAWWSLLCCEASRYGAQVSYLEAILSLSEYHDLSAESASSKALIEVLVDNLHSSSAILRMLSLRILRSMQSRAKSDRLCLLSIAMSIEQTPKDLQEARSISQQSRRLASEYEAVSTNTIVARAIPHFCFGMLTYKLAHAQEAALETLKEVCKTKSGKNIVCAIAFDWLEKQLPILSSEAVGTPKSEKAKATTWLTEFQCSNLANVKVLLDQSESDIFDAFDILKQRYDHELEPQPREVAGARNLALRVLLAIPQIAEQHSPTLVPTFLSWAARQEPDEINASEDGFLATEECVILGSWRQKERKAMVRLFTHFNKPQKMFMADRAYEALKQMLTNGDTELQRLALRAICTWRDPAIEPYKENLFNLLDNARLRDEITTFLSTSESNTIRGEHRATVMPLLLRLLYGLMIARGSSKSGKGDQSSRRKAILRAVSTFEGKYIEGFVQIALDGLGNLNLFTSTSISETILTEDILTPRKQVGVLTMIKTFLDVLSNGLQYCMHSLFEAILYCNVRAIRLLHLRDSSHTRDANSESHTSLLKVVRQISMQCLNKMAASFSPDCFEQYIPCLFSHVISPRMDLLPIESSQSISGTLQIFSTWAKSSLGVYFLTHFDKRTLKSTTQCLLNDFCKDEVKIFVIEKILLQTMESLESIGLKSDGSKDHHDFFSTLKEDVLAANADHVLSALEYLLGHSSNKAIVDSGIRLLAKLASLINDAVAVPSLLTLSIQLLDLPAHQISPKSKSELLLIVNRFLRIARSSMPTELQEHAFRTLSSLFRYFKDRESRQRLCQAFRALADGDTELESVAAICEALNAYAAGRLDEPDFDQRLKAFSQINEGLWKHLSLRSWTPLIHNMLFFINDAEELAIRSSAGLSLRRFVEAASTEPDDEHSNLRQTMKGILLPSLRKGAFALSELVRSEHLSVMAALVQNHPTWEDISDMHPLLMGSDEEASIFANMLHIQQHRRMRALRRLATHARKENLRSPNVAHFLIPLVEHFIFDAAADDAANNLSGEAIATVGELTSQLDWPQFKAVFRRYSGYLSSKSEISKRVIKLLGVIIDSLGQAIAGNTENGQDHRAADAVTRSQGSLWTTLSKTVPQQEKLAIDVLRALLPSLTTYVHDKDESTVSFRVPVAVSATKLLSILPREHMDRLLPSILTDVCNILRSRAQESRDLSRQTLAEIVTITGPSYFGFVLRELRSALARGYQLHVLSFTVHSLLVATSTVYAPGDLDYCLPQIVTIIIDDVFGTIGQEKDAEEYVSKMKEVRSRKSLDSMEIVASLTSVDHLAQLIKPIDSLMDEKIDLRTTNRVDELMRRISAGLGRNQHMGDQRALVFCHEILRNRYDLHPRQHQKSRNGRSENKQIVIMPKAKLNGINGDHKRSLHKSKLISFALDLLRTILHKHDDLRSPANIHGFIPAVGDAILQTNEEVQGAAIRLLTTIIKVPLNSIDENAEIYVAECVKIVENSSTTNVELAQSAYKLISAILRERQSGSVRKADLALLIRRLIPDLEEPRKQSSAFKFLRAIIQRKVIVNEVYEAMDVIRTILVKNATSDVRDMARSVFVQFLTDCTQVENRLSENGFSKQIDFLVSNLEYKHAEGRRSVLETFHILITRRENRITQSLLGILFMPLVLVVINDESDQCREMAGALLYMSFNSADVERKRLFLDTIKTWMSDTAGPLLERAAWQVLSIYYESQCEKNERELRFMKPKLSFILTNAVEGPTNVDWQLLYYSLQVFSKICQHFPENAFALTSAPLWSNIRQCLSFPHAWIKLASAKLIGTLFASTASFKDNKAESLPLRASSGLLITEHDIAEVTRASLSSLRMLASNEELANQSVRNALFLARVMIRTTMPWPDRVAKPKNGLDTSEGDSTDSSDAQPRTQRQLAITHLIQQVSKILCRPPLTTRAPSLTPLKSALQLMSAVIHHMPVQMLCSHLDSILQPLYQLTDSAVPAPFSTDTAFNEGYDTLKSHASDLMSSLQEEVGTTEYVKTLQSIAGKVKRRREGRRTKRAIEKVAFPEISERHKRKKGEKKREKRKERSSGHRALRRGW